MNVSKQTTKTVNELLRMLWETFCTLQANGELRIHCMPLQINTALLQTSGRTPSDLYMDVT
jgi:hypothetical protein